VEETKEKRRFRERRRAVQAKALFAISLREGNLRIKDLCLGEESLNEVRMVLAGLGFYREKSVEVRESGHVGGRVSQ